MERSCQPVEGAFVGVARVLVWLDVEIVAESTLLVSHGELTF